ncbi:MAG TPA: hypothetical protein VIK56_04010 [Rhodoferax sp.]
MQFKSHISHHAFRLSIIAATVALAAASTSVSAADNGKYPIGVVTFLSGASGGSLEQWQGTRPVLQERHQRPGN